MIPTTPCRSTWQLFTFVSLQKLKKNWFSVYWEAVVQPLQHHLHSQHSQHCACLGGFEHLLGLLLCHSPGFRLPNNVSAFYISLWLYFKTSGRPWWFHKGGFLCGYEPYLKLPQVKMFSFTCSSQELMLCQAGQELLTECSSTLLEKPEMRRIT